MREGFQVICVDLLWEEWCSHSTPTPEPRTWPGRWPLGLTNGRQATSRLVSLHKEEETPETLCLSLCAQREAMWGSARGQL